MIDEEIAPVGLVLGSEATSTQEFKVVLHEGEYLQLDDLVVVKTQVPKVGEVDTYGIVVETSSRYEGTVFESDTFRVAVEGTFPAEKSRTATIHVIRVLPETWIAPDAGEPVFRAVEGEREKALYVDEMRQGGRDRALPVGTTRDGEPVWADIDFFDGTKGAHMSISGVSGVATKTSYALFFLRCLTSHPEILGQSARNLRVLVFNVKGEDLMFLDKPNKDFEPEDAQRWERLGMEATPFQSVSFWAPAMEHEGSEGIADSSARSGGIDAFRWTPREFIDEGLLQFVFVESNDLRNQLTFVAERVAMQLQRFARDVQGEPGAVVLRDPASADDDGVQPVKPYKSEKVVRNLYDLIEALIEFLEPEDAEPDFKWTGRVQPGTIGAFMRRLYGAAPRLGRLIRAGESRKIDRAREAVTVVDIHKLHDAAQRFVVGALIKEVHDEKEGKGRFPLSVIVLDELNKYAPREGWSPIRDTLVDIAQRGRSLGILLIGAQQSASRIHPDVLTNASLKVSGRLDAAEVDRAEYGWMLPSTRSRARLLKPGTMVLSQPSIPAPVVLEFPYPPWATRPEEEAPTSDPFEGL
ncbi:MAG TPA: ATP-binding protein [Actinomycetota bacterium]|nr:ATP-binding protein [Actinomycetota bacterium]